MTESTRQSRLDDMIRKVEGLFKKAEATKNEHESDAFFAKAQALMAKHGIEEEMLRINDSEIPVESVVHEDYAIKRSGFFDSMVRLALACAEANNVRCLVKTPDRFKAEAGVRFVGLPSNIIKAKLLYVSLLGQCMRFRRYVPEDVRDDAARHEAWSNGSASHYIQKWRRDFSLGFAQRIGARLAEIQRAAEEAARQTDNRMALVLADRKDEVDQYWNRMAGGPAYGSRARQGPMADAFGAGQSAANRADLGQIGS
jgi:hypothetical protein